MRATPGRIARKLSPWRRARAESAQRPLRTRSLVLETVATSALYVVVAIVAVAFASPWLPRADPAGPALDRYQPLKDGASVLFAKLDASGEIQGWSSQNRALTPWLGLFNDVRKAPSEHLIKLYGAPDLVNVTFAEQLRRNEARGQIYTTRLRELDRAGQVTETILTSLRDERGELLVSFFTPADGDLLLDPPIVTLPSDLELGRSWESEGLLGAAGYRWSATVAEAGPLQSPVGSFDDCLRISTHFTLTRNRQLLRETTGDDWYCADAGLVESDERDVGTGEATRSVLVGRSGDAGLLPPRPGPAAPSGPAASERPDDLADPDDWVLTRVGRGRVAADAGESTIPPLWIPGDPPLLLVAGYAGDLLALNAGDDLGTLRWRFRPPSTIYSPPAYDPAHGRIYFGAGDRHLYALDARGLFLWSYETGDNVATRPLLVEETSPPGPLSGAERGSTVALVVFGSEDGTIYALDADTGQERWRASAAGPVVSSPVLAGGVVAIGSDDGTVYGLDPATGRQRWQYTAGGPVEAPIVVDEDGKLYVASRDGTLAALDPSACDERCEASWETKAGSLLRQAPAIGAGRVFSVDDEGYLVAFDAETGRRLWATPQPSFVGPPALADDVLVVARKDGDISRLDLEGVERGRWASSTVVGPVDERPKLAYGPTVGGGALWLADDGAVIRRLGPPGPLGDAAPLQADMMVRATQPPFDGGLLFYTPVEYQGVALVLNASRGVHLVDPESGRGVHLVTIDDASVIWPTDPVVDGDTLLVTVGTTLHTLDLPTGRTRWTFPGNGTSLRPPTVAGDTVLWPVTQEGTPAASGAGAGPQGVLYALGLADGAPRWQAPLAGFGAIGGVVVQDGTAFVSSPPAAYDLATGALRWRTEPADLGGLGLGGPTLDPAGSTLFVGAIDPRTGTGQVVALDAASGRPRWRGSLQNKESEGTEAPRGTERLWLDGDTLIVPTLSGPVIGLDAGSGRERWRYRPTAPRLGSITVADGRAWLVLENAHIVGLDTRTGQVAAHFRDLNVSLNGQGINQRPAIVDGHLVAAIGRMLLAFPLP